MQIPGTLAIKLAKAAETAVKKGHPWVFEQSIEKGPADAQPPGSLCVLFGQRSNKPFAFGLWDPAEVVRIKIIDRSRGLNFNEEFLSAQLEKAFILRKPLLERVTGYRAVHGENDGFPGIVLDVYDKTGVFKIYSEIWTPYLGILLPLISKIFHLDRLVFRRSRKLMDNRQIPYREGEVIGKALLDEKVQFEEYGVSFLANPVSGHKTGFFLDQRPNRYWVQQHARNKVVLDVFSYVGGFGIHALKGGAASLTSLDISAQAMEVARENILLNNLDSEKWNPIVGDAFTEMSRLIQEKSTFDVVILDPPSFAKQASEVPAALRQYERLAQMGAALTAKNGYLILSSCSSRISIEEFKKAHRKAFGGFEKWQIVKEVYHDVDHPVTFPEAQYLKTVIYRKRRE